LNVFEAGESIQTDSELNKKRLEVKNEINEDINKTLWLYCSTILVDLFKSNTRIPSRSRSYLCGGINGNDFVDSWIELSVVIRTDKLQHK